MVIVNADPQMQDRVRQLLSQLWEQHKPTLHERAELLIRASEALQCGTLSDKLREEARSAAHKLAGALGTFGHNEAGARARELEEMLTHAQHSASEIRSFSEIANALREDVENT